MKTLSRLACIALAVSSAFAAETQFQPRAKGAAAPPLRVPDGVQAHRDLAYVANGHARQKLDLYVP
ncbi:MAG: hypothetical protein FJ388_23530, partial [Verrucomicrobia bacterium]|nr:hypothetical protein [Verrucomicrobiota bacterium]